MTTELEQIMSKYAELTGAGRQEEARSYIMNEFPKLPQNVREQLLGEMLTIAMEDEVEAREALTDLREEGIAASETLERIEKEIPQHPADGKVDT